uniref:Uncharacterized protein n=1 Tax=Zea mays TaxID=4577 RepID=C4J5I8_MAIZE|nr:unknown [Zea mays]
MPWWGRRGRGRRRPSPVSAPAASAGSGLPTGRTTWTHSPTTSSSPS